MRTEVKVYAPATVANVAVGYDILGFAIDKPGDEIVLKKGSQSGLIITEIIGNTSLSTDIHKNTAGVAAHALLKHLDLSDLPLEMTLYKHMKLGTGMGSSAASAVAGAMAVNAILDYPLSKSEILQFTMEGEQVADGAWHADNVAPSLFGGIVLIRDNATLDVRQLPVPKDLYATVIHPHIEVLTSESRAILDTHVTLGDTIAQTGNIAAFITALYENDLDLLSRALVDHIIEPQRKKLIPHFDQIKEAALKSGALGFSISGAGPSMFALSRDEHTAKRISSQALQILESKNIDGDAYVSTINTEGAKEL